MSSFHRHDESPTRIVLLSAFLAAFLLLLIQRSGPNFSKPVQRAAEDKISPIAEVFAYPVRSVEGFFGRIDDRRMAFEHNFELRQEIAKLRESQERYDFLTLKIKGYERILSVDPQLDKPLRKIAARAVSETRGPFVRSLLLNAGRNNDIQVGNPVLSPDGMIGHVINAGNTSARVLRLEDLNSRIPIINQRSDGKAILSGDNTARPLLSFTQTSSDWQVGDIIVTSGDDGMLPAGLPIGTVVKSRAQELRVKLYAENIPVDWVWVSPFIPVTAPTEGDAEAGGQTQGVENAPEVNDPSAPEANSKPLQTSVPAQPASLEDTPTGGGIAGSTP